MLTHHHPLRCATVHTTQSTIVSSVFKLGTLYLTRKLESLLYTNTTLTQ
jgi:hypothetical protein